MPIMPRVKGKAEQIAYKVLGIPSNIRNDKIKTVKNRKIKERLHSEQTRLVR